ncbi:MAG: hypothetical protein ACLP5H_13225 [Desulfomonilaceae bacterium]
MTEKPKNKARDVVRDIRSGMTDSELMEKYGLSAIGLQSFFLELLEAKAITHAEMDQRRTMYHDTTVIQQIDSNDIVKDIRSGMTDSELMKKYDLSSGGLRVVLQTLTDAQVIPVEELYATSSSAQDTVFAGNMRKLPRHHLLVAVDIYVWKHPEIKGILSDITEKGIAITGIAARVGEAKTFVIPPGDFIEAEPVLLEARCQWAEKDKDSGEWIAGFGITRISAKCLDDLRRLIESLPFFA